MHGAVRGGGVVNGGVGKRGGRGRHGAGAARAGLSYPALKDAHVHVAIAQRGHDLNIHAGWEEGFIDDWLLESLGRKSLGVQPRHYGREVGVAHVDA